MGKLFSAVLLLTLSLSAFADIESVDAIVDRNPVMLDEAITLTVVAKGDAEREAFDSSVLLSDFVVGRTSVSSKTQIINFQSEQSTTWTTTLFPRKTGKFTIPAFTIEGVSSQPIFIEVIPVPTGQNQPARDFFITTEVNNTESYLQQQLQYTVKLYLATGIERGSLQPPTLIQSQIQQIGEDKQYTDIQNGKRYQIIERTFAIIPQQSGDLTIRGPIFSGEVLAPNTSTRFGMFNRTTPINRVGPDIDVTVLPIPSDIDYPWLPSEFVDLTEEWQSDTFVVGEPVTRTLVLTAAGLVEEQIPEIEQFYPPDFKTYPDQASTATVERDKKLISQRTESIAVIPTKVGKTILPEVTVPWFNVKTKKTEFATIPARQIDVMPATVTEQGSTAVPSAIQPQTTPLDATQTQEILIDKPIWSTTMGILLIIVSIVSTLGWFITWLFLRRPVIDDRTLVVSPSQNNPNEAQLYKALMSAAKAKRSDDAYRLVYEWLSAGLGLQISPGQQLGQFQQTQKLAGAVEDLVASRYGRNESQWQNQKFIEQIAAFRQQYLSEKKSHKQGLSPLYPTTK